MHTEILLPDNAPREYFDRSILWNAVEKIEKHGKAQLTREIRIALPRELSLEKNIELAKAYAQKYFVSVGMCADVCVHDDGKGNPHAHIMLTMRPFKEDGIWNDKQRKKYHLDKDGNKIYDKRKKQYACSTIPTTDWNEHTKAEEWREGWANILNEYLENEGVDARVDHRSYERQGVDTIPTIHLGVAASAMEKRGIFTDRGNINRVIEITNQKLRELKARISELHKWIKEEIKNTETPTLADVISKILNHRKQLKEYERYHSEKYQIATANMLNFLTEYEIKDLSGLDEKFKSMIDEQSGIVHKLKPINKRLEELDKHIKQAENYLEFRDIYNEYKQQKPRNQKAFYEKHHREISLFEVAKSYLDGVMNGKTSLPIENWKTERMEKIAEKKELNAEYQTLKEETAKAERIRKNVYDIMGTAKPKLQKQKDDKDSLMGKLRQKQMIQQSTPQRQKKKDDYER